MKSRKMKKFAVLSILLTFIMSCLCACSIVFPWGNTDNGPQKLDFTQMTYVAFGDSITWGEDGQTHQQMKATYAQLVAEELELKNVGNFGKRGASITFSTSSPYIGTQLVEAPAKADIVSVMIGVNDFLGAHTLGTIEDTTADSVYGGLNYLAKELLKKYPNAFIFFMTPLEQWKSSEVNSANYKLIDVANAIKEVCTANGIAVLDLYATGEFSKLTDPNSDGLHPTQKFIADYTAPKIVEFIQDKLQAN